MNQRAATQYLRWVRALPSAALLATGGLLIATCGLPPIGLSLLAIGIGLWCIAVTKAWTRAVRSRHGRA